MCDEGKLPFDIPVMLRLVETAVQPYPKAAMFELVERGYRSLFQRSSRASCRSERGMRRRSRSPIAAGAGAHSGSDGSSEFHEAKAKQIRDIALRVVEKGDLPADYDLLTSFSGVEPKCANLALGISTGEAGISVDIHVHRVTNRWGIVHGSTPEKTMTELEKVVPRPLWLDLNRLLVPFGKHICTGTSPKCSSCPVLSSCSQVGVDAHR